MSTLDAIAAIEGIDWPSFGVGALSVAVVCLLILLLQRRANARLSGDLADLEDRSADADARIAALEAEAVQLTSARDVALAGAGRVPGLERELGELRREFHAVNAQAAELEGKLEAERKAHSARVEEIKGLEEEIDRKFAHLANRALSGNAEAFLKLVSERFEKHQATAGEDLTKRQAAIEAMMKPVSESLQKFEARVGEIEKAREGAYHAVLTQVRGLAEGQMQLRSETLKLVQALRAPKARGRWGEIQLRQVFELAGMVEHVDFLSEKSVETVDGRLRPDAVVRLPGGKSIVVDAKTPLDAYLTAIETEDETAREAALAQHSQQVNQHVRNLSGKDYWNALDDAPDFVVMFIPGEAFYAAALQQDPGLFERAFRARVLIANPTTLIALIKAIAYGWSQEKLARNAQEIAGLARELFDRVKTFGGHMESVGRGLRQSVDNYNRAVATLESRILPTARKFEELGVPVKGEDMPQTGGVESEPRRLTAAELIGDAQSD